MTDFTKNNKTNSKPRTDVIFRLNMEIQTLKENLSFEKKKAKNIEKKMNIYDKKSSDILKIDTVVEPSGSNTVSRKNHIVKLRKEIRALKKNLFFSKERNQRS